MPVITERRRVFHYTFAAHEDESDLAALEQRRLFGTEAGADGLFAFREIAPDRSPFLRTRLKVRHAAPTLDALAAGLRDDNGDLLPHGRTFKVVCLRSGGMMHDERRAAERQIGGVITGTADMKAPDRLFGAVRIERGASLKFSGRFPASSGWLPEEAVWLFGELDESDAAWLRHKDKPRQYSTALGTRAARAIANVAVPDPAGVRAVDPCCGIGTVLLEALSMGIAIEGFDQNPLAVRGARENLRHFGYPPELAAKADMRLLTGQYDTAILDLPYNKCSVLPSETLAEMLGSLRRIAGLAVIVTVEAIDDAVHAAGFRIADRCVLRKSGFARQVLVCE